MFWKDNTRGHHSVIFTFLSRFALLLISRRNIFWFNIAHTTEVMWKYIETFSSFFPAKFANAYMDVRAIPWSKTDLPVSFPIRRCILLERNLLCSQRASSDVLDAKPICGVNRGVSWWIWNTEIGIWTNFLPRCYSTKIATDYGMNNGKASEVRVSCTVILRCGRATAVWLLHCLINRTIGVRIEIFSVKYCYARTKICFACKTCYIGRLDFDNLLIGL